MPAHGNEAILSLKDVVKMKRLRYVPGLISLAGLFIVLPRFYKNNSPVQQKVLTSYIVSDCTGNNNSVEAHGKYGVRLLKCALEKGIIKRKQIRFTLNGTETDKKLKVIRYEALKLKYTEDTSTVIIINLKDNISYGNFVSLVDMCHADEHKRYASWDNKFVIFGEWPKREVQQIDTVTPLYCGTKPYKKPGFVEMVIKKTKDNYTTQGLYLCVGFTVLLTSFLISRKKQRLINKNSD